MELIDTFHLRREPPDLTGYDLVRSWEHALGVLKSVNAESAECCMWIVTRSTLFKAVRALHYKSVLDIGTYIGFSALTFALAVGQGGKVTTVDIREQNTANDSWWKIAKRDRSPAQLMDEAGVADRVEFVCSDSRQFMLASDAKYDLICIDGWHTHQCVYEEIDLALDRLNPGGLIFMDDVQPLGFVPNPGCDQINGPASALQRHMSEGLPVKPFFPIPGAPVCFVLAQ